MRAVILLSTLALAAVGCASGPRPTPELESSGATIRSAEVMDAQDVPIAETHLRLAKEQFERAQKLLENKDNDRAQYLLLRAQSDAEVAVALARASSAKAEAEHTLEVVKALRAQTERPKS